MQNTAPRVADHADSPLANPNTGMLVIGIGNAGCNIIQQIYASTGGDGVAKDDGTMASMNSSVDFLAVDTDQQKLANVSVPILHIGKTTTKGEGTGSNPEKGELSAEEMHDDLIAHVKDRQMVLIVAGLGGGTGTGASLVVARLCRDQHVPVLALVSSPWSYDSRRTWANANTYLPKLTAAANMVVRMPNENLEKLADQGISVEKSFGYPSECVQSIIALLTDMLHRPGMRNIGFADFKTMITHQGLAMISVQPIAPHLNNMKTLIDDAIGDPLYEGLSIREASTVMVYLVLTKDFTIGQFHAIHNEIRSQIPGHADYRFGFRIDAQTNDQMKMLLITGGIPDAILAEPSEEAVAAPSHDAQAEQASHGQSSDETDTDDGDDHLRAHDEDEQPSLIQPAMTPNRDVDSNLLRLGEGRSKTRSTENMFRRRNPREPGNK